MKKWVCTNDSLSCHECQMKHNKVYTEEELDLIGRPPIHGPKEKVETIRGCRCYLKQVESKVIKEIEQ